MFLPGLQLFSQVTHTDPYTLEVFTTDTPDISEDSLLIPNLALSPAYAAFYEDSMSAEPLNLSTQAQERPLNRTPAIRYALDSEPLELVLESTASLEIPYSMQRQTTSNLDFLIRQDIERLSTDIRAMPSRVKTEAATSKRAAKVLKRDKATRRRHKKRQRSTGKYETLIPLRMEAFLSFAYNLPHITDRDIHAALLEIAHLNSLSATLDALNNTQREALKLLSDSRYPDSHWRILREHKEQELIAHMTSFPRLKQKMRGYTSMYHAIGVSVADYTEKDLVAEILLEILREIYPSMTGGDSEAVAYLDSLIKNKDFNAVFRNLAHRYVAVSGMKEKAASLKGDFRSKVAALYDFVDPEIRQTVFEYRKEVHARQTQKKPSAVTEQTVNEPDETTVRQEVMDEKLRTLHAGLHEDSDDEFDTELYETVRALLPRSQRKNFAILLTSRRVTISEKNFFLELINEFERADHRFILSFGLALAESRDVDVLEDDEEESTIDFSAPIEIGAEALPSALPTTIPEGRIHLGLTEAQYGATVIRLHGTLANAYTDNRENLTEPERKVLRHLVGQIASYGFEAVAALDFIQREYGDAALVSLFLNPSLLLIGYTKIYDWESFVSDRYAYDLKRAEKALLSILHSIPSFTDTTGRISLDPWFDINRTNMYHPSFVIPSFDFDTGDIIPLTGWVKEMEMVATLQQTYGSSIVWNPRDHRALRLRFGLHNISPDAIDTHTGTLIEITSKAHGNIKLNSRSHLSKRAQLLRYKQAYMENPNIHVVELVVMGRMNKAVEEDLLRLMAGVPFRIRYVDYRTLETIRVVGNETEAAQVTV